MPHSLALIFLLTKSFIVPNVTSEVTFNCLTEKLKWGDEMIHNPQKQRHFCVQPTVLWVLGGMVSCKNSTFSEVDRTRDLQHFNKYIKYILEMLRVRYL